MRSGVGGAFFRGSERDGLAAFVAAGEAILIVLEALVFEHEALETEISVKRVPDDFPRLVLDELAEDELAHHEGDRLENIEIFTDFSGFGLKHLDGFGVEIAVGGEEAIFEVKTAEGAAAGVEVEATLGAWSGEDDRDFGVGMARAKVENELLVRSGETVECGYFFHNIEGNCREGVGNP